MAVFKIFEGLHRREIADIFGLGIIHPIEQGTVVLQKGDIGREMFVILTGKVEILDSLEDDREILAELGPGDIFGEMAIFDKVRTRSAYAVASERSQVLEFNADTLNKFFEHEIPKRFLVNIIGLLCHRLRTTDDMYISARCQKI